MEYVKTTLLESITIKKIISVHYFEYAKDYVFEGEKHDFWELLYVDKGEVEVMADTLGYQLKQGEMIFHKPNEFHNVWANGKVAPNLIVIAFDCKSPDIRFFENKIINISNNEKNLLARIVEEAKEAFSSPLNDPELKKLEKKTNSQIGCEQLIRLYLEQMLLTLIRRGNNIDKAVKLSSSVKERSDNDIIAKVISFLEGNIKSTITFDDVCRFSSLSRTQLKVLFKSKMNSSVMEYYNSLKIAEAKKIIREGSNNFTEIASILDYSSIHYFSKHFKKATGMTPSQYASSVKIKIGSN